jgi:hypothetical protein
VAALSASGFFRAKIARAAKGGKALKQAEEISRRQMAVMLFVLLALEQVMHSFGQEQRSSAQAALPALFLLVVAAVLLLRPVCAAAAGVQSKALCTGHTAPSRVFLVLCAGVFAMAMGESMVQAERFLRYSSDAPLPAAVVYLLFIGVAAYGVFSGISTLLRLAGLLLWGVLFSVVLLLTSNITQMRVENLSANAFSFAEIGRACAQWGWVSPAWALFFFFALATPTTGKWRRSAVKVVIAQGTLTAVLLLCCELVLGERAAQLMQPVYTLGRMGAVSVFQRLDALHAALWLAAAFLQVCLYGVGLTLALAPLLPQMHRKKAGIFALCIGAAAILPTINLSIEKAQDALTVGTIVLLTAMVVWHYGEQRREARAPL